MTPATVVPPARFAHVPAGWHVSTSAPIVLLAHGAQGTTLATTWLANLSARDGWSAQLHPGRAAIQVTLIRRTADCPVMARDGTPRLHLPLVLAHAQRAVLDGTPLEEDRFEARLPAYDVDLRIDYGVPHPSRAIRQRVQRMLSLLRFPAWPARC